MHALVSLMHACIWPYHISSGWEAVRSVSAPRVWLGVGVIGGHLYAAGGLHGAGRSVECYVSGTDSWEPVGAMYMSQNRIFFSLTSL